MLAEAVRTIQRGGVESLTLRRVGEKLGVSRTALYRHFTDKSALLAAVAQEGFRMLRLQLLEAWQRHDGGREGFKAMGAAYVQFAVDHPSHYRVMFGGFVDEAAVRNPGLAEEGAAAFQGLVDAIISLQQQKAVKGDDPLQLAQYIWATVHGIAMLAIDGQLKQPVDALVIFMNERLWTGIRR